MRIGTLIDRFVRPRDGAPILRVRDEQGVVRDVTVPAHGVAAAAALWGGAAVRYQRRGGRWEYVPSGDAAP